MSKDAWGLDRTNKKHGTSVRATSRFHKHPDTKRTASTQSPSRVDRITMQLRILLVNPLTLIGRRWGCRQALPRADGPVYGLCRRCVRGRKGGFDGCNDLIRTSL